MSSVTCEFIWKPLSSCRFVDSPLARVKLDVRGSGVPESEKWPCVRSRTEGDKFAKNLRSAPPLDSITIEDLPLLTLEDVNLCEIPSYSVRFLFLFRFRFLFCQSLNSLFSKRFDNWMKFP